MDNLHEFHSLDGVAGGRLKGVMARSVSGFIKALKDHRVCSDAGDYGAITAWVDDAGSYRCSFAVYQCDRDTQVYKTKSALREWLNIWHPKLRIES